MWARPVLLRVPGPAFVQVPALKPGLGPKRVRALPAPVRLPRLQMTWLHR